MQIELTDIQKTYRDAYGQPVPALRGVDLTVRAGQFVAITGSSGCGKSTLLNVIGCLDQPDRGSYCLDGQDVAGWPESRRAALRNQRIGFVFQSFHLLPFLSVRQNVELPFLYCDRPIPADHSTANLLRSVGLEGMERRFPGELSGGQQQRVAIARALVLGADLLLADEPTGNLDSVMAQTILDLFVELEGQGKTVVLVTHDAAVARRAARQVEMADGKVIRDTTTEARGAVV